MSFASVDLSEEGFDVLGRIEDEFQTSTAGLSAAREREREREIEREFDLTYISPGSTGSE